MLRKLWPALEAIPGAQATLAEWRDRLGADLPSLQALLRPTDQFAASIPAAGDPYTSYQVVWHAADDIVGVHDCGGPTITLTKADVLIYRLDYQRLIRHVAAALGLETALAVVEGIPHTYRIGTYRPFAGFAFSTYLTLPLESADLQYAAEKILSMDDEPIILLAPTGNRMRPACKSLLVQRKACFLPLSESIETDSQGNWSVTAAAKQQLAIFQQAVVPQAADSTSAAFFPTPPDATWSDVRIKFIDGETVSIKAGVASGTFAFSQMGMVDGRNAKPTKQWELLRSFAQGYGVMNWNSPDARRQNQKRRESLARDLKSFFRIDGEPIEYIDDSKGWRTLFTLEPDA